MAIVIHKGCCKCEALEPGSFERFDMTDASGAEVSWNVSLARMIVAQDPERERFPLDTADLCGHVARNHIEEGHLAHVPAGAPPVIIAQAELSEGLRAYLIDGNHRVAKAILDGKKIVFAYIFTEAESASCLMGTPKNTLTMPPHVRQAVNEFLVMAGCPPHAGKVLRGLP